jgi:hypothetical protein
VKGGFNAAAQQAGAFALVREPNVGSRPISRGDPRVAARSSRPGLVGWASYRAGVMDLFGPVSQPGGAGESRWSRLGRVPRQRRTGQGADIQRLGVFPAIPGDES